MNYCHPIPQKQDSTQACSTLPLTHPPPPLSQSLILSLNVSEKWAMTTQLVKKGSQQLDNNNYGYGGMVGKEGGEREKGNTHTHKVDTS